MQRPWTDVSASDEKTIVIENLLCSFCGKSQDDAFALVSSGQAHICDECIETATALVTARKANEAVGLLQEELAHCAKIHQTYLSGAEKGHRDPSLLVLDRIERALDADVEDLVQKSN
jgi:ATP-dependent Clp protease ATP-binding subunit ClpX